ncbi:MAG: hypothetical protein KBA30_03720 [Clostridia bacterium]|nr:hypothetical protein [Clostridia bacterium]
MKRLAALAVVLCLLLAACGGENRPEKVSDGYRNYYEVFVRSFCDSDGDGLGDLAGVTSRLDYIGEDLGADGIWLMPIMPSPSYHKYDVTDYFSIDPEYGTLEDFDTLLAEAHARDIHVIIDLVLNHTSNLHLWFDTAVQGLWSGQENEYASYYTFTTEERGEGYARITDRYFYECRFWSGMPDLNLDHPAVRGEIRRIAEFWLDRGVDGFRLDAVTSYYTGNMEKNIGFLSWFNDLVKELKPDAYLVGEAWSDSGVIASYYESGVDSFFNFPYSQATGRLVAALNTGAGDSFASGLAEWNRTIDAASPAAVDALFLSNHDQARSAGFLMRDPVRQKTAAAMYLLAPGNPFIYYGEEIGMTGSGADPDKRLPMLWSADDPDGTASAPPGATQTVTGIEGVDKQTKDGKSLLNHYRNLLRIKAENPEIARGVMESVDTGIPGIAALSSTCEGRTVYVFHNLTDERRSFGRDRLPGPVSAVAGYAAAAGGKPRLSRDEIILPPWSSTVIR